MLVEGLGRPPKAGEVERLLAMAEACAAARGAPPEDGHGSPTVWHDVSHTILMLPEFSHVE
jgi:hypothetical protein